MSLLDLYRSARSLEAIENYALADEPLMANKADLHKRKQDSRPIWEDRQFWHSTINQLKGEGDKFPLSGKRFFFYAFALSEWVARVPGLFWSDGAAKLRRLADSAVQYESKRWVVLHPQGKSEKVLGGIGTIRLPPDVYGRRLVSFSAGHNASCGIPTVVSPEVWEHLKLREGCVLSFNATWQPMDLHWAARFCSVRGIPRGYLVLNDPEQVEGVVNRDSPTQIHPFTVMEYSRGDAILYDFVYATADTKVKGYKGLLEDFFDFYKNDSGRYGRYLLSADVSEPLWEADYASPSSLQSDAAARAQLDLLEARVRRQSFKGKSLDVILALLAQHYNDISLKRLSTIIELPASHWFTPGSNIATLAAQLLDQCLKRNKVEELLDAVALEYPESFLTGDRQNGVE